MEYSVMTGNEKAARLFGEMDSLAASKILECLSPSEIAKLHKGMRRIGTRYNPFNPQDVEPELTVLELTEDYGKRHGIWREVPHNYFYKTGKAEDDTGSIQSMVKSNPDAVAQILGNWLREGK